MKYLNALNKISGVGSQKMKLLVDFFRSGENAWQASQKELMESGLSQSLAEKIVAERKYIDPNQEWEKLQKENIHILEIGDERYPASLREISNPPYLLYIKGKSDILNDPMLAVIGSRKFTSYGKQVAYSFSRDLAQSGVFVVSGMALGIDSIAHEAALEVGGKTIAVLGSSLEDEKIGPRSNFQLSRRIIENGALISEYPLGTDASPGTFPARNRIMAGMTMGTLVVEAAEKSGSLITANLAIEFNREVFAVPGSVFSPSSQGTNSLIKNGAKLIGSVQDVLEELNLEKMKTEEKIKKILPETEEEKTIFSSLSVEPIGIDRIIRETKLKANVVISTLVIMEMKGLVKSIGSQNYIKL